MVSLNHWWTLLSMITRVFSHVLYMMSVQCVGYIKGKEYFVFYFYTDVCKALYPQGFLASCEQK